MDVRPGTVFGPYHVLDKLGEGGMGAVYRARDTRLDRLVALKISQASFADRVEREARAASALNHPNIAQLYDVGSNYLVMELVDGTPIAPVESPRKLLDLAVQLADALSAIARLLAKDPGDRYDSTRDLYRELRQIRERLSEISSASRVVGPVRARPKRSALPWILANAGVLTAAALAVALTASRPTAGLDLSAYRFTPVAIDDAVELGPSWSPDGRVVAYTKNIGGVEHLFTRVLGSSEPAQITSGTVSVGFGVHGRPLWSPDGTTLYFTSRDGVWAVANSGGSPERLFDRVDDILLHPDGQTFVFVRDARVWRSTRGGEPEEWLFENGLDLGAGSTDLIAFSRDGARLAVTAARNEPTRVRYPAGWLPAGEILATGGRGGVYLMARDFKNERQLTSRNLSRSTGFSKDGREVFGIVQNTGDTEAEWQLWSIEVASGRERLIANLDLPPATDDVRGFSLHPDGTRFATSIAIFPYDIWMLEGFEQKDAP